MRDRFVETEISFVKPCTASPGGEHKITLAVANDGKIVSVHCPCDGAAGDSLERLGAVSCVSWAKLLRSKLRDGIATVVPGPSIVTSAFSAHVQRANTSRQERAKTKLPVQQTKNPVLRLLARYVRRKIGFTMARVSLRPEGVGIGIGGRKDVHARDVLFRPHDGE